MGLDNMGPPAGFYTVIHRTSLEGFEQRSGTIWLKLLKDLSGQSIKGGPGEGKAMQGWNQFRISLPSKGFLWPLFSISSSPFSLGSANQISLSPPGPLHKLQCIVPSDPFCPLNPTQPHKFRAHHCWKEPDNYLAQLFVFQNCEMDHTSRTVTMILIKYLHTFIQLITRTFGVP